VLARLVSARTVLEGGRLEMMRRLSGNTGICGQALLSGSANLNRFVMALKYGADN
jgi:hypothetical protein